MRLLLLSILIAGCAATPAPDGITNLYDAFGPEIAGTKLDWGFAALVRYRGQTILFDSGANEAIFARNCEALEVDLDAVDFAMLSHAHSDHFSGFDHVEKVRPGLRIYLPADGVLGAPSEFKVPAAPDGLARERRYMRGETDKIVNVFSTRFPALDVAYLETDKVVAPGVTLVATRSPFIGAYTRYPPHEEAPRLNGLRELALSLETPKGEVVITGCAHSDVTLVVEATKKATGRNVYAVVGGFHLFPYERAAVLAVARKLREQGVQVVVPGHCTGHLGFEVLEKEFPGSFVALGLGAKVELPPRGVILQR